MMMILLLLMLLHVCNLSVIKKLNKTGDRFHTNNTMNALLSVTPIIVESARLSLLNIKQQGCPSILFKLDSKSFQN